MGFAFVRRITSLLLFVFLGSGVMAQPSSEVDGHVGVALRMIGHQLLLASDDSTSLVKPITTDGEKYMLAFEDSLVLDPTFLIQVTDSIFQVADLSAHYIIEVKVCGSEGVVYGFERNLEDHKDKVVDVIPCGSRIYEKDCYIIYVTFLTEMKSEALSEESDEEGWINYVLSILLFGIAAYMIFRWISSLYKRRQEDATGETMEEGRIKIGKHYLFDRVGMTLMFNDELEELTAKEADLLLLLVETANEPLRKEVILEKVWGDQGDYIGRTLDVFISKLRKKLAKDENLKIVNLRGVGYKLIITNKI